MNQTTTLYKNTRQDSPFDLNIDLNSPHNIMDTAKSDPKRPLKASHLPSPPISPEEVILPGFRALTSYEGYQDPPLYPETMPSGHTESPLFQNHASQDARQQSNSPDQSQSHSQVTNVSGESPSQSLPTRKPDSGLRSANSPRLRSPAEILNIRSVVDLATYTKACIDEASKCRRLGQYLEQQREQQRDPYTQAQVRSLDKASNSISRTSRVNQMTPDPITRSHRHSHSRDVADDDLSASAARRQRPLRVAKSSRPSQGDGMQTFMDTAFPSPVSATPNPEKRQRKRAASTPGPDAEKKHKRAPPSKVVSRKGDDSKWRELPDYCPPLSILDQKDANPSWGKGGRLDCSQKEDFTELHSQEREICEVLRIEPQQYLANKRRIFVARLEQLNNPSKKGWNKTACQQACGVDVNKSSQLFVIFDKLGWFDRQHFEKWM